jgi:betaine reductase
VSPVRAVHYINQFFAGRGGEEAAGHAPESLAGAIGPGRPLARALGEEVEIVATVFCGDDLAAAEPAAIQTVMALIGSHDAQLVIAGPAFTSGRYGIACARVAAAAHAAGMPALAAMHPDNPGVEEAGQAPVVAVGQTARQMREALERIAAAARALAAGKALGEAHGVLARAGRTNRFDRRTSAERAVALLAARLAGVPAGGEIPLPRFDRVRPAPALARPEAATVALATEGALVPQGNPDRLESARATKWLHYSLEGRDGLSAGEWISVHGGFSTQWANADPHRILPLDIARELEREGRLGRLHGEYLVTAGNGTSIANAKRFGTEWAARMRAAGISAAILTAT